MSRRRAAEKRSINPDAKFGDLVLAKFINCLMIEGKKSVGERIVYEALEKVHGRGGHSGLDIFHQAIANVRPTIEVRSRRVGGATYQVPTEVRHERAQALAVRWLISIARKRSEKTMVDRMSAEFLDASNNRGTAVKKREDTHKMAEAKRAFAHYRW